MNLEEQQNNQTNKKAVYVLLPLTVVPWGASEGGPCEGEDSTVPDTVATDGGGGAEPREGCSSPLLVDKDVSPALIDSIIASTSSAVGNSFNVGEGTRPAEKFKLIFNCTGTAEIEQDVIVAPKQKMVTRCQQQLQSTSIFYLSFQTA